VLTGVTSPADAILAPPSQRPTYLAEDLAGLLEPHPEVTSTGGTYRCGGWTASRDGGQLKLAGGGARIDGLRALCAAAWAGDDVTAESARAAAQRLDAAR
jgi:glycerol-1-phosphatase